MLYLVQCYCHYHRNSAIFTFTLLCAHLSRYSYNAFEESIKPHFASSPCTKRLFGPHHAQTCLQAYEDSKDPDQTLHPVIRLCIQSVWSGPASVAQLDAPSDWRPGGRGFKTPPRSATFSRGDWSWNIFYGHSLPSADSRRAVVSFWWKNVHNTG